MKPVRLLATIAASMLLFTGCAFTTPKDALVTINNDVLTKTQFEKELDKASSNSMFSQMGVDIKKDTESFMYQMVKDKIVQEFIAKSLLDQEIKKNKIKVSDKEVKAEMAKIIEKVGSKERFDEIVKQNGVTIDQVKKDIAQDVKIQKLLAVVKPVNVSDAEVTKYYNANKANFNFPERVRASHILIKAMPEEIKESILASSGDAKMTDAQLKAKVDTEMKAKQAKAEKLLSEVKKDTKQFAKLATENSDDTGSAKQGGDLGFFTFRDMVEPFSKAAFSMKPGTISGIVKTSYGYHIIMVTDRAKAGVEPLDKVKGDVKTFLENQQKFTAFQELTKRLRDEAKITYNDPSFDPKNIQEKVKKLQEEAQKKAKETEKTQKK